jgi:transposase-like protein
MQLEAETTVVAEKNKQYKERNTYFSGIRILRFDTRLGTLYLLVAKLRNGGYIPFLVLKRKRSEQALIQVIREAFINGSPACRI